MNKIVNKISKYMALAKISFLSVLAYPADIIANLPLSAVRLWMLTELYKATYATASVSQLNNTDLVQTIWIIMITNSFAASSYQPISATISQEIISGSFAYSINKPYSYMLFHFSNFFGKAMFSLILNLILGSIIANYLVGSTTIYFKNIILSLFALFLGYILRFLLRFSIGLSALWTENSESLEKVVSKIELVFGGTFIPLVLMPGYLQTISYILPFGYLFYFPADLIVNYTFYKLIAILLVQLFWLIIIGFISSLIFKKGIKSVSINGG